MSRTVYWMDVFLIDIVWDSEERDTDFENNLDRCYLYLGLPRWVSVKNPVALQVAKGRIPRSGKSPGGGNGNPLQYSCLVNPMDRGTSQAAVQED